ncbi:Lrp/AsnC family transcriptional regulator [Hyphomonas sp.]|uniref:Lrp/AsnC family transcriptional regulator n=1 Tax=Hyphomonas sp. TaxID=87 RepID=UPI00391B7EC5
MSTTIDRLDRRILEELQEDASISATALGEKVGLSQTACWRRVQRLEEEGVIRKRVALVDAKAVGCETIILAHVKLNAHGRSDLDGFAERIRRIPNVLECFVVLGEHDFFLKIAVKDIFAYEKLFFEKLSSLSGVAEVRSSVALSQIKNDTALPILETTALA